jgi:U6 snRNA-associated Sm-like protein LSm4
MLPLQLLNTAKSHPIMVELKTGETFNGILTSCDNWMNLLLTNVVCTSPSGDVFSKIEKAYIRGSMVKYLRIPDQVIEMVKVRDQGDRGGRGGSRGGILFVCLICRTR